MWCARVGVRSYIVVAAACVGSTVAAAWDEACLLQVDAQHRPAKPSRRRAQHPRAHSSSAAPSSAFAKVGWCDFGNTTYALFIDGSDSPKGPEAYGEAYIAGILSAWKYVKATLDVKLNAAYVKSIHDKAWPGKLAPRLRTFSKEVMKELSCMRNITDSSFKQDILKDLSEDLVNVTTRDEDGAVDSIGVKRRSSADVEKQLTKIINHYTHEQQLTRSKERQLTVLAQFLRSLAWLHPFQDGNGRSRTLLLQREVRRLQLGCGAMMFNNNADIYFESSDVYLRKISEGIAAADQALSSGQNPWMDAKRVEAHSTTFPLRLDLAECESNLANYHKTLKSFVADEATDEAVP